MNRCQIFLAGCLVTVSSLFTQMSFPFSSSLTCQAFSGAMGEDGLELELSLDVDVSRFGSLHTWIGANPENRLSLSGRAGLKINRDGLVMEGIDARVGRSDLRGSVTLGRQSLAQAMNIDLSSERLDFNELASLFPETELPF